MTQEALSRWDSSGQSTLSPWVADVRADPSQTSLQVSSHIRTCFSAAPEKPDSMRVARQIASLLSSHGRD